MPSSIKTLSDAARDVLSRARVDTYRQPNPLVYLDAVDGAMPRPLYKEVDAALVALGGKWSKRDKAHAFSIEQYDQSTLSARIADVVDTGAFDKPDNMGYFPTPRGVVDYLIMLAAPISQGHRVLEPSAGQGAIADRLRELVPVENMVLVEIQEQHAAALKRKGYDVVVDDFLAMPIDRSSVPALRFDRIVMNPPFERGQSIDHVLHAFDMLKVGGILVSVMPVSIMFRMDRKHAEFREFVAEYGEIMPIADHAFRESGTDVKTVAVVVTK